MSDLNIYQRINAIMKDKNIYLKKGSAGQGTGAHYDELIAILAPKLTEHGIVVTVDKVGESRSRETKKGSYVYESDFKVSYINIDNPSDRIETIVESHAQDGGDKAPGKANTYAAKTSMLKVFGIETGDNEESRAEIIDSKNTIDGEQFKALAVYCLSEDLKEWTKLGAGMAKAYNIAGLGSLPASKYDEALRRCKAAA